MARDAQIHERLQRWAQGITVGDGSGYPSMSIIHPEWQPPSPGVTPTLKSTAGSDVRETHRAIATLSSRLVATVVVYYVLRPPLPDQARMLGCTVDTVHGRIERVHRQLAQLLNMTA